MCNLFYIPVIVILKQAAVWFLILASFGSLDQYLCLIPPHNILDPTINSIKVCCSFSAKIKLKLSMDLIYFKIQK